MKKLKGFKVKKNSEVKCEWVGDLKRIFICYECKHYMHVIIIYKYNK